MEIMRKPYIACMLLTLLLCRSIAAQEAGRILREQNRVLYCHAGDLSFGRRVMDELRAALPVMMQRMGIQFIPDSIRIIVTGSEKEFQTWTCGQIPDWGMAAADPLRRMMFLNSSGLSSYPGSLGSVVRHELSHLLFGMILKGRPVARWFDEGMAMFLADEMRPGDRFRLSKAILTGQMLSLEEMEQVLTFRREKAALAYAQARTAVDYLIETYGEPAFRLILIRLHQGHDLESAFQYSLHVNLAEFEQGWKEAMQHRYGWLVLADYRLLFAVSLTILFILAFWATRRRTRRIIHLWEQEEIS